MSINSSKYTLYLAHVNEHDAELHEMYSKSCHQYSDDSGVDIFCPIVQTIEHNSLGNSIKLGVKCELVGPEGYNYAYQLVPRSSISKTPLRMSNSIGIIDAGYRGEILAKVDNLSDASFDVEKGASYFQILTPDMSRPKLKIVPLEDLSKTKRGSNGFGSTGFAFCGTE